MNDLTFSVFNSPHLLTKRIDLVDGKLVKSAPGSFVNKCERFTRPSLSEVMAVLDQLGDHQAAGWGVHVADADVVPVDTVERVDAGQTVAGAIARSQKHMTWSNSAGVLMIDADVPHAAEDLRQQLIKAGEVVGIDLAGTEMFYRPSSSAGVYAEGVPPLAGGRIYMAVEQAGDIPRIGQMLFTGLWLLGRGRIDVSSAGMPLVRTLIDGLVWQAERMDFVAPAVLGAGVMRQAVPMLRWGLPDVRVPALQADLDPRHAEEFDRLKAQAIRDADDRLHEARRTWVAARVKEHRKKCDAAGMSRDASEESSAATFNSCLAACETQTLDPTFRLFLSKDRSQSVTVGEILANPKAYHGTKICDPLELAGTFGKAKIYTNSAPLVMSFLHGGQKYRLVSQARIEVDHRPDNLLADHIKLTVNALHQAFAGQLYKLGASDAAALVYVSGDGGLKRLTATGLTVYASQSLDFVKATPKGDVLVSMPPRIAQGIVENVRDDALVSMPEITQVVRGPFLVPKTGEIISEFGYHAGSKTYLHLDGDFGPLLEIRSKEEAIRVAGRLIMPYADFSFYDASGVPNYHAAMVLLLVLLVTLRSSVVGPNLLVTASRAGVGKTYVVRTLIAELGQRAAFEDWSHNADEAQKILVAWALKGLPYLAIDNHDGALGGVLEALTDKGADETLDKRILGVSASVPIANNALIAATGVNLRPASEAMARRSLDIMLTGECAWAGKEMKFPVAPVEYVLANWRERRMLALSLVQWGHQQRMGELAPRLNSLPDFDRYIRRLVHELYGIDLFAQMLADVEDVAAHADYSSPKGLLYYAMWEMCRAHARSPHAAAYPDRVKTGRVSMLRVTDEEHEAMLAVPGLGDVSRFAFTMQQARAFVIDQDIDANGSLEVVTKSAKGLPAAGKFNGMALVATGDKDLSTGKAVYRLTGCPDILPTIKQSAVTRFGI
jgi:hypothetical protein